MIKLARLRSHLAKIKAASEQANKSNDDQINGNDEVEQARHEQNKDTGDEGNQRSEA
jgi:hypothetical protein